MTGTPGYWPRGSAPPLPVVSRRRAWRGSRSWPVPCSTPCGGPCGLRQITVWGDVSEPSGHQGGVGPPRQITQYVGPGIDGDRSALRVWITLATSRSPRRTTSTPVMAVAIGLPTADIPNALRKCAGRHDRDAPTSRSMSISRAAASIRAASPYLRSAGYLSPIGPIHDAGGQGRLRNGRGATTSTTP